MKLYKNCIFLDMGHGGIVNGVYTTAPSKMFKHGEKWFYEGVKNRDYGYIIKMKMEAKGINVVVVNSPFRDNSLYSRSFTANTYHENVQNGIFISEHSNATGKHNAKGMVIYTSKGNTRSDKFATMFGNMYSKKFPNLRLLKNMKDGDLDFEADFHVCSKTKMPAILLENRFFDNYEDYKLLMSKEYKEEYCQLVANWAEQCIISLE